MVDIATLPTEFRGCFWDEGWEFDGPCVVYYPWEYRSVGEGGNDGCIEDLIESICIDLSLGDPIDTQASDEECKACGWNPKGFAKRKRANHITVKVKWKMGADGPEIDGWEVEEREGV